MQRRQKYVDDYHEANRLESELWDRVKGHGPGQPEYDPALWQEWLDAVGRTTATSKALREAFSSKPD